MSKQGPRDPNETAFRILREATGESPKTVPSPASPNATARGKARAEKLTSEQRKEIARKAALARWHKEPA